MRLAEQPEDDQSRSPTELGGLSAQVVANFSVDAGRVARGIVDEFKPAFSIFIETALCQQVGGLHDGLDGIAQIVRQGSELTVRFDRGIRSFHTLQRELSSSHLVYIPEIPLNACAASRVQPLANTLSLSV